MFKFLERKTCFFCGAQVKKKHVNVIKYKAVDGSGTIETCPDCAKDFEQLKQSMGDLYDGDI